MRHVRFVSFGLLILGLAARADAGPTYGGTYSVAASGGSLALSFPQFDPSLGTLSSITFAFTGATSGNSVSFENRSKVAETFEFLPYIAFGLTAPNVNITPMGPPSPPPPFPSYSLQAFDGAADFSGPDSTTLSLGSVSGNGRDTFGPGPPSGYVGTGLISATLTVSLAFDLAFQGTGGANPAFQVNSGTITGTYSVTYNTVPGPSSLFLACIGAPFGFLRRRLGERPRVAS